MLGKNQRIVFFAFALVALLALSAGAFAACNVSTNNLVVETRSDSDYYSTITAPRSTDIDIRITFNVASFSGDNCSNVVGAFATIYRYNGDTSTWELYRTTSTKTQELANDSYSFVWSNEFNTGSDDKYTRFKVDGTIVYGSDQLDTEEAFIDVQDNSCDGINLVADNITIDEGTSTTRTLRIQNNTNREFVVGSLNVLFTSSLFRTVNTDYDSVIPPYSTDSVMVSLDAGYVNGNSTSSATFDVSGYLAGDSCSSADVGRKTFSVTINDTGAYDNYYNNYYYDNSYYTSSNSSSSTISDCKDIALSASDSYLNEGADSKQTVLVKNNTTKRFEILDVKSSSTGLTLTNYFKDKYVFPGEIGSVILNASAPSVVSGKSFNNTVWVSGRFADGRSCSFDNIGPIYFSSTVADSVSGSLANCSDFSLSVPSATTIQNFGALPVSITNNTNKRADVYVEGTVESEPTLISVPSGSSISRTLSLKTNAAGGEVIFRPQIEGCQISATKVLVTNTANGSLAVVTLTASKESNGSGGTIVSVEANNPTNKAFMGTLSINGPAGWSSVNRQVVINPGKNTFTDVLVPQAGAQAGEFGVLFSSNGQQISTSTGANAGFAGLFSLGAVAPNLGFILLVLVVVILIAGILYAYQKNRNQATPVKKEPWQA